jgi:hypothetical protein
MPIGVIEKGGVLFIFLKSKFDIYFFEVEVWSVWLEGGGEDCGIAGSGLGAGFTAFAL